MADEHDEPDHATSLTGEARALGDPLRIEGRGDGSAGEVPLTALWWASSPGEARAAAARLVEHGLGATVAAAPGAGGEPGFEVRVLPTESHRAAEVLGGGTGAAAEGAPAPPEEAGIPWKVVVAIWLAAMIVLPLAAGVGTYLLLR